MDQIGNRQWTPAILLDKSFLKRTLFGSFVPILMFLSGCGGEEKHPVVTPPPVKRPVAPVASPDRLPKLQGMTARNLIGLFGSPDQDIDEPWARRLQFQSSVCVLDAYLYPPHKNEEMVVRHVDVRDLQGNDFNQENCLRMLVQKPHHK
ncbi:MAG: hypothetical protein ABF429_05925 [Zymomonas mobilis]|uniref:hypothetical protein n=1 Tax=Zymomonas mobilis TaxID=542 RepID=UPI0001B705E3|nr:hypothetical protein Za10_1250 [Zymomonas mobilis subsp. mobilis NCIMB 11163]MCP9308375.1 hypothetical protein [Zymomonas mobilis]